jgi:hypothetical protein
VVAAVLIFVAVLFAAVRILKGPIGQALARRIGGTEPAQGHDAEVTELRARLAELEERMDFTERVLLQQQEPGRIAAGEEHS